MSAKESIAAAGTNQETDSVVAQPTEDSPESMDAYSVEVGEGKTIKADIFKGVKKAFTTGTDAVEKVGTLVASKSKEVFRNKALMKRQMLFYGVIRLYNGGLEKFMNM
jgi:hypothetical protein